MKIALLGAAGFVGRAAAARLLANPDVSELLLVDYDVRAAKRLAKSIGPRSRFAMADAGRPLELSRLLEGIDVVAGAIGPAAEYDETILRTCADAGTPAAVVGDRAFPPDVAAGIDEALRRRGVPAVAGCGLHPGWTDLLSAHFLPGPGCPAEEGGGGPERRFLFIVPERFGGYGFFRKAAGYRPASPPEGLPEGGWFADAGGDLLGVPPGRPSAIWRPVLRAAGRLGPVGRELAAAFLFWARGLCAAEEGTPAAVAGVLAGGGGAPLRRAVVADPAGRLAGALLAETAVRLFAEREERKGLLPLTGIVGREEAVRIAAECGGRIESFP